MIFLYVDQGAVYQFGIKIGRLIYRKCSLWLQRIVKQVNNNGRKHQKDYSKEFVFAEERSHIISCKGTAARSTIQAVAR